MTKDDRTWFVRKIACDTGGSTRLRRQLQKQRAFAALTDVVRIPSILDEGEQDGLFYFDMEFVRGSDGVSYLRRATYSEVTAFTNRLCRYLEHVARTPINGEDSRGGLFEALNSKLCEVQSRTALIGHEPLAMLFMTLERIRKLTAGIRTTACHGDLTLENMVVDARGELWMLDFLDAPFEHYWQDLAKLHQDLDGGWYLRAHAPISRCVLEYISHQVRQAAMLLDERYSAMHAVLLAFTFVRILPYVKTEEEQQFVIQRIEHFARRAHEVDA